MVGEIKGIEENSYVTLFHLARYQIIANSPKRYNLESFRNYKRGCKAASSFARVFFSWLILFSLYFF